MFVGERNIFSLSLIHTRYMLQSRGETIARFRFALKTNRRIWIEHEESSLAQATLHNHGETP